jgi:hypothetical protein
MFGLATLVFLFTGLRVSVIFVPMATLLLLYNIGGGFSLMPVADEERAIWFVAISVYMAVMAIVVAAMFSEDAERRVEILKSAYVAAAVVASITGIMGYFNVAGTFDLFTRYSRAKGTFKDPNVFSTFLALPTVMLIQGFVIGNLKRPVVSALALLVILAGLFLSFSRGAWIVTIGATVMTVALTFITSTRPALRTRIIVMTILGIMALILLLAIALQFEAIRSTFEVRASLNQDYDQGETGRFGNQRRSVPLLLELPNGFGPTLFRDIFPEDPHNTYLNAFASYGWLGGVSYLALVLLTVFAGFRLVFRRTPWQPAAIAIWSSFFLLILQGIQIDTDHWRHWYLQLGLVWGLTVATMAHEARLSRAAPEP